VQNFIGIFHRLLARRLKRSLRSLLTRSVRIIELSG
jgi:hypothetical protein